MPVMPPSTQSSQPICQNQSPQSAHSWCTFEAVDTPTIIIEDVYLAAIVIVLAYAISNYIRLRQFSKNRNYEYHAGDAFWWVYAIVFMWGSAVLVRVGISVIVYYLYMQEQPDQSIIDPDLHSPIVLFSVLFNLSSFATGFFINLVIMLVAYQWIKVLLLNVSESQLVTPDSMRLIERWLIIIKGVRIYFKYLRNFYLVFIVFESIMFYFTRVGRCSIQNVNYYFTAFESLLTFLFYLFCHHTSRKIHQRNLLKITKKDKNLLNLSSLFLSLAVLIRMLISLYLILWYPNTYKPNANCLDLNIENDFQLSVVLGLKQYVMHLLPLSIILYVFRARAALIKEQRLLEGIDGSSSCSNLNFDQTNYRNIEKVFYKASIIQQPKLQQHEANSIQYS